MKGLCFMGECTVRIICECVLWGLFIVKGCFTASWNENKEGSRWRGGTTWPLTKEPQCTSNKWASLCNASKTGAAFVTLRNSSRYSMKTVNMFIPYMQLYKGNCWHVSADTCMKATCQDFVCFYFDKLAWRSRRHYCNTVVLMALYQVILSDVILHVFKVLD